MLGERQARADSGETRVDDGEDHVLVVERETEVAVGVRGERERDPRAVADHRSLLDPGPELLRDPDVELPDPRLHAAEAAAEHVQDRQLERADEVVRQVVEGRRRRERRKAAGDVRNRHRAGTGRSEGRHGTRREAATGS